MARARARRRGEHGRRGWRTPRRRGPWSTPGCALTATSRTRAASSWTSRRSARAPRDARRTRRCRRASTAGATTGRASTAVPAAVRGYDADEAAHGAVAARLRGGAGCRPVRHELPSPAAPPCVLALGLELLLRRRAGGCCGGREQRRREGRQRARVARAGRSSRRRRAVLRRRARRLAASSAKSAMACPRRASRRGRRGPRRRRSPSPNPTAAAVPRSTAASRAPACCAQISRAEPSTKLRAARRPSGSAGTRARAPRAGRRVDGRRRAPAPARDAGERRRRLAGSTPEARGTPRGAAAAKRAREERELRQTASPLPPARRDRGLARRDELRVDRVRLGGLFVVVGVRGGSRSLRPHCLFVCFGEWRCVHLID